ncbi:AAA domain-containing protein [Cryomorpha ignava]|uniref:AAA domain-containing protein n=1 Tax=Cryomorpha ignava TaxID=101383 RepID=A0A7K3WS50_9FLAO|nr:DNA repair ATPase [Cryomorpha ignava]NEN23682.1 AAA domain-containing protein [Cryomorpha ignava]
MQEEQENTEEPGTVLEQGTYEIIKDRLLKQGDILRSKLDKLNEARKDVFGAIETTLLTTERITTENNCVPRDMVAIADNFIFGYNVFMGLKSVTLLTDVFNIYEYKDRSFIKKDLELINNQSFIRDFENLYKYYKQTQFAKFAVTGPFLYIIFKIGDNETDIKVFKWQIDGNALIYSEDRAANEFSFPDQQQFRWKKTTRDMFRDGLHPHISIEDQIFVETVGGDLTIKIEDNTEDGKGIFNEPVEYKDQVLHDAEILYSIVGNLIFLKIKPYKENTFRYIIYNKKIQQAMRVDDIENACVLLPEDYGVIFPKGYYLQTGESKIFNTDLNSMLYEKTIESPNGEDFLYIFYNRKSGTYILLSYNLISQTVANPVICHGYSIFGSGEMCYFKGENEAQKHHAIQIWQTPYLLDVADFVGKEDSFLSKIGNKDIVKGMAESNEVLSLIHKKDSYANLYIDIVRKVTGIVDSFYWLDKKEAFNLSATLAEIRTVADSAINEFEKVIKIKKNTQEEFKRVEVEVTALMRALKIAKFKDIDEFVKLLAEIRNIRGQVMSLTDLRYINEAAIENYEEKLKAENEKLSQKCVKFLLKKEALSYYETKVKELSDSVHKLTKVVEANELEEDVLKTSKELEMLIEIVSNLKIEDATQTTTIINNISEIYASFNQINAALKRKRKELFLVEGEAEFHSQLKLISQGIINYLDISDTTEKCEEYLTKLMIQLEELEGKFSEFDEFLDKISEKRTEVYNAFEARKVQLIEKKNKRTSALQASADRILAGVKHRLEGMENMDAINGYMASDLMVDKLRNIVQELIGLGDTVKADEVQGKLKSTQEDAIRQLKDKTDLYDGENLISFGKHKFSVNNQLLDLTIVPRSNAMFYHVTGTNFFEEIKDPKFLATREVWDQELISENNTVYRSEYLALLLFNAISNSKNFTLKDAARWPDERMESFIAEFVAPRYDEGYSKGVHDEDAALILWELLDMTTKGGVLKYDPKARVGAIYFWNLYLNKEKRQSLNSEIKGAGIILKAFPNSNAFSDLIGKIESLMIDFSNQQSVFLQENVKDAASYLFAELADNGIFSVSKGASDFKTEFQKNLKENKQEKNYQDSIDSIDSPEGKFTLIRSWLLAFAETQTGNFDTIIDETALVLAESDQEFKLVDASLNVSIEGIQGEHSRIANGELIVDYHNYNNRLRNFHAKTVPAFQQFKELKKELIDTYREELKLNELKPRVMNSFVRNELINKVYLPMIGDNLAKQIGTADANKRTDLMGMLLLISPPGYGKTTLMEYIASRLGVIFLKINGPAIGHEVTSLDPTDAPNAGAREEIEKLNLGLEMGDNVMIYLDDIQHCNPEFLQKFISLCDAQRKIEGVYKGKSKTYDLRGKKVSVVMAGNPYTESGDKFKIPDMLANRADIYNLGDILGGNKRAFELSYIENSLTSNSTLRKLSGKSQQDLYTFIQIAETGESEGLDFESNHSAEDIADYVNTLKKLIQIRDVVLKVNQQYIQSAAMEEQYRMEPSFKLQGSYRNMNKMAERVVPIMNEDELKTLIMNNYENESQTLTTSAEANLLKFKSLMDWQTPEEEKRWQELIAIFLKNQKMKGFGGDNQIGLILNQMEALSEGLFGIKNVLAKGKGE